ncbi:MAG: MATE family efflux transporter [Candidatus Cloacimonadota bacterium]|nr:MATE family efflux transporter [Candidatus Cloacimonadota bacterium]
MKDSAIDLTRGNLLKNLIKLSLPIVISNFLQMFYNLTDVFWLGKLGDSAQEAVSVAGMIFPLIFFLISFGFGFVVAGTSLVAQYKGADKPDKMRLVVGQFTVIIFIFTIVFVFISIFFIKDILHLLQTPETIFQKAITYFTIILSGMPALFIFLSFQSFARGLGDTISPLKVQVLSILINVVLDPILIFGVGFIPRMETTGAAIATLFARVVAALVAIYFIRKNFAFILPKWKHIKPNKDMLKRIFKISVPASLGQSITSFGFLILQAFVNSYGVLIISTFSIGKRLTSFFMVPSMGISQGLAAIVGQNIGANNIKRAEKSLLAAVVLTSAIMLIGCSFTFFFGAQLTRFFINSDQVIELGKGMFKLLAIASFFFSIAFVFMGVFNGAGHTKPVLFFSLIRLWILRLPLVYLLSGKLLESSLFQKDSLQKILKYIAQPLASHPYNALWWSMVISNIIITLLVINTYRKGKWKRARIND